jgi:hypothetical protein
MNNRYSDDIENLPIDNSYVPSKNERDIVDSLFGVNKSKMNNIVSEMKDLFIIGILFILFSIKNTDELIGKAIPITQTSVYILLLVKTIAFMILFWIIKNFYLSRSN